MAESFCGCGCRPYVIADLEKARERGDGDSVDGATVAVFGAAQDTSEAE